MSWAPLMLELGTFDASSRAPLMPRVGHLSCLKLGTFDASSWAPLMPRVGHLSCLELGTFDASSWAPLSWADALGTFEFELAPLML